MVLIALNALWFARLDFRATLVLVVVALPFYCLARILPVWLDALLFLVGWGLGVAGHQFFEKNRPSVTKNLQQAIVGVGPMMLLMRMMGWYEID